MHTHIYIIATGERVEAGIMRVEAGIMPSVKAAAQGFVSVWAAFSYV